VLPAELLAGVRRYRAYCDSAGKVGTAWVKMGATFFGPDHHYAEPFEITSRVTESAPHAMDPDEYDAYRAAEDARVREGQARRDAERAEALP